MCNLFLRNKECFNTQFAIIQFIKCHHLSARLTRMVILKTDGNEHFCKLTFHLFTLPIHLVVTARPQNHSHLMSLRMHLFTFQIMVESWHLCGNQCLALHLKDDSINTKENPYAWLC